MLGETIKDWKLVGKLGKGGMGEVWVAEQQIVRTKVAVKLLLAEVSGDKQQVQRFFNEAIAVSKIKHAGIVRIFDVGFHEGRAYLVMELLEGETIAQRLARMGRLPLAQVAEIGRQIANVLEATHAASITHRDLKPDNIFLVSDEELASGERVKVLDFGIAKLGGADATAMTASSTSMGTPAYMAPEQWNNAATADARSDVYALGCLLFEVCAGRPPFVAHSIGEACTKHLTETPPRVSSIVPTLPAALDDVIARMLEKAPAERATLAELTRVLAKVPASAWIDKTMAAPVGPTTVPTTTTLGGAAAERASVEKPRSRLPLWLSGGALALALVGAGMFIAFKKDHAAVQQTAAPAPTPASAPPAVVQEPVLGLQTLAKYMDPKDDTVSDLKSESLWAATHDDFAEACARNGAPKRWCAARDFAAGQTKLSSDVAAAIEKYRAAIAIDPSFTPAYLALAGALSTEGNFDEALKVAQHAQRLDPKSWLAIAVGARAYSAAAKLDDSLSEYRRALSLAPENPILLAEAALAYHAAGMDDEADRLGGEAFKRSRALFSLQLREAERALEKGNGAEALAAADRALATAPKAIQAHLARGDALQLLKRKPEAIEAYRKAAALDAVRGVKLTDPRLRAVVTALAKGQLPPGRTKIDRTRPNQRGSDRPARSRPGCSPNDPLCGMME